MPPQGQNKQTRRRKNRMKTIKRAFAAPSTTLAFPLAAVAAAITIGGCQIHEGNAPGRRERPGCRPHRYRRRAPCDRGGTRSTGARRRTWRGSQSLGSGRRNQRSARKQHRNESSCARRDDRAGGLFVLRPARPWSGGTGQQRQQRNRGSGDRARCGDRRWSSLRYTRTNKRAARNQRPCRTRPTTFPLSGDPIRSRHGGCGAGYGPDCSARRRRCPIVSRPGCRRCYPARREAGSCFFWPVTRTAPCAMTNLLWVCRRGSVRSAGACGWTGSG
jgi:hypothetical protein